MRLWLELNQEEGEKLFEAVKGFTVDRMKTAVGSLSNANPGDGAARADKVETAVRDDVTAGQEVKATNTEDKPALTIEAVRAILTEKKQSGKDLKALFSKLGVKKLSEVAPADYSKLLREVEAL